MFEMDDVIEESLWNATRGLEERAMLLRQAGTHTHEKQSAADSDCLARAQEAQRRANAVRPVVLAERKAVEAGG